MEAEQFVKLLNIEWSARISRFAQIILDRRRLMKELPLPTDMKNLGTYLVTQLKTFKYKSIDLVSYLELSVLREACLTTYNRRRPGEVEAIE